MFDIINTGNLDILTIGMPDQNLSVVYTKALDEKLNAAIITLHTTTSTIATSIADRTDLSDQGKLDELQKAVATKIAPAFQKLQSSVVDHKRQLEKRRETLLKVPDDAATKPHVAPTIALFANMSAIELVEYLLKSASVEELDAFFTVKPELLKVAEGPLAAIQQRYALLNGMRMAKSNGRTATPTPENLCPIGVDLDGLEAEFDLQWRDLTTGDAATAISETYLHQVLNAVAVLLKLQYAPAFDLLMNKA